MPNVYGNEETASLALMIFDMNHREKATLFLNGKDKHNWKPVSEILRKEFPGKLPSLGVAAKMKKVGAAFVYKDKISEEIFAYAKLLKAERLIPQTSQKRGAIRPLFEVWEHNASFNRRVKWKTIFLTRLCLRRAELFGVSFAPWEWQYFGLLYCI